MCSSYREKGLVLVKTLEIFGSYVTWSIFNTRNRAGFQPLDVRIPVYFLVAVCTFLSLCACTSCYLFAWCFIHVFDLVYNGSKFIFLCSSRFFRYPPNISSKFGGEFILAVLYIDGLSLFFIFHQTWTYRPWPKCYIYLAYILYAYCSLFLGICDSIA